MAQVVLSLSESLQDEATCPICLEFFRDPVITDCSHNFCRECFTQHCRESAGNISCPQCRKKIQQKNLRPNRQLANMVEIAMKLSLEAARRAREIVCEKHKEPLKLFCESDQSPICLVCRESEEHRAHAAVPIEEAAQHYKVGNPQAPLNPRGAGSDPGAGKLGCGASAVPPPHQPASRCRQSAAEEPEEGPGMQPLEGGKGMGLVRKPLAGGRTVAWSVGPWSMQ